MDWGGEGEIPELWSCPENSRESSGSHEGGLMQKSIARNNQGRCKHLLTECGWPGVQQTRPANRDEAVSVAVFAGGLSRQGKLK